MSVNIDPKFTTVKALEELPMPTFKKMLRRDFMHIQKLYVKEELRVGKGMMYMEIDEKGGKFDVTYVPVSKIPKENGLKAMIEKVEDGDKFMRILGIENNKCVTLKLEKQLD